MIPRILQLPFGKRSFFLFGPRQTGKSTLVKKEMSDWPGLSIDLLKRDTFLKYNARPEQLRLEIEFMLKKGKQGPFVVFIDEIQKLTVLLDEIHYLIEEYKGKLFFVLTGSSVRKLKRSSVNMLAGRAWEFRLYPLTFVELGDGFDINTALLQGTLPPIVSEGIADAFYTLEAYSKTYLKEEIFDEALVRNLAAFSRFLEIAADQSGKIVNFSTIARDTGVTSKTVKSYYEILEDTLIAHRLEPYLKSARKRLVTHPKYYLFDLGVINSLTGRSRPESILPPSIYGVLFEHFVILETIRLMSYRYRLARFYHWRSAHGAEVDLVIEEQDRIYAVEVKSSPRIRKKDISGLRSFCRDYPRAVPVCVSTCDLSYLADEVRVLSWHDYFEWLGLS